MTCVICKNGQLQNGVTNVTMEQSGATVVFKAVPANICNNCGEEYFDESVTANLLELTKKIANSGVELDVRTYRAKAA